MKNLIYLLVLLTTTTFAASSLKTIAEMSDWIKTGRADETEKLCHAFAKRYPKRVQCKTVGLTPEKRKMVYMVVGDLKDPVVWVQAGIHAGEIDGKDAVFWLLREVLEEGKKPDPFKGICMVFLPIMNLDGHERVGKWNRPNQVGPEEMGWRTTAQNLNLNRDFLKVDAPEMRMILKLWHKVNPVLSLDLHVTDGAQFQPEVGLIILPNSSYGKSPLHLAGGKYETDLLKKMTDLSHLALPYYPSFIDYENPLSGFAKEVAPVRFAHGYWSANNRLGMLVETHSWKNYANRVKTHHDTVLSSLELAQLHGKEWEKISELTDAQSLASQKVDLYFKNTDTKRMIDFPGYKFTHDKSEVSGAPVVKYFPDIPEIWKLPLLEEIVPELTVTAPAHGYLIQPADFVWMEPILKVHQIKYEAWKKGTPENLQVFRASKTTFANKSSEGHQTLTVEGEWKNESPILPVSSIFIPINQPRGKFILHLLEPQAPDSLLGWGFFNRAFEQKEYMESYVAQDVALEMLKNPEIKKEFETKLKANKEFAASPEQRFEFFYKKHPSYDERFNKYPVYKF